MIPPEDLYDEVWALYVRDFGAQRWRMKAAYDHPISEMTQHGAFLVRRLRIPQPPSVVSGLAPIETVEAVESTEP